MRYESEYLADESLLDASILYVPEVSYIWSPN